VFFLSAADDKQMDIRNDLRNARKRFEQELKILFRCNAARIDQQNVFLFKTKLSA